VFLIKKFTQHFLSVHAFYQNISKSDAESQNLPFLKNPAIVPF
jgi:hypothetical protein